jgi:hypothetical protein
MQKQSKLLWIEGVVYFDAKKILKKVEITKRKKELIGQYYKKNKGMITQELKKRSRKNMSDTFEEYCFLHFIPLSLVKQLFKKI